MTVRALPCQPAGIGLE